MASPLFRFTTTWYVPYDLITVWNQVGRVTHYPTWWPDMQRVELLQGPELPISIGSKAAFTVASPLYTLHYTTTIVDCDLGKYITVDSEGDLVGRGRWVFNSSSSKTAASFTWEVALTPPLLRRLAYIPFVRPAMRFFTTA